MKVTSVRIKPVSAPENSRLRAYCSVTFDDVFLVHDVRIIQGQQGLFLSMPSRKIEDGCTVCGNRNHILAKYCNRCGGLFNSKLRPVRDDGKGLFYLDVAHPIISSFRKEIQDAVLEEYYRMLEEEDIEDILEKVEERENDEGSGQEVPSDGGGDRS